ncbi:transposase [Chloroflexota bacterium]
MEIDTIGIEEDHVPIFVGAPSRHSMAEIVQIMKSITVEGVFKKFPNLNK